MADPRILALEKEAEKLRLEGQPAAAVEKIQELLALDPGFVRAHLTLAVLYHQTGEHQLACRHAERACELEPGDSFNFVALSVTYQKAFEATRDPIYIQKAEMAKARAF